MDLHLFSIDRAPKQIPPWELILDDLGRPPVDRIAKALGVGVSTVFRWNKDGSAPKTACLALYWLTRWGRSAIHVEATNDAIHYATLAAALHKERAGLRSLLEQAKRQREHLAAQVAHFAARAEGLAPAVDLWGPNQAEFGGDAFHHAGESAQNETFRGVLLTPPGQRLATSARRTVPGSIARDVGAVLAGSPATTAAASLTSGSGSGSGWAAPADAEEDRLQGREATAEAFDQVDPRPGSGARGDRSAGAQKLAGRPAPGRVPLPLPRPPSAASLGADPQAPSEDATEAGAAASAGVFSAMVRASISPTRARRRIGPRPLSTANRKESP